MTEAHRTEDLSSHAPLLDRLRGRAFLQGVSYAMQAGAWMGEAAKEIERLQEIATCPRLTATAPVEQIKAVLHDWDKGREVNTQDLINALAWRVDNQRREIARLNEALRRKASDEAPSFSPNFDERNGIR